MNNQKREKYEPPVVEVLVVAVEYGFAGTGGGGTGTGSADATLPDWGHNPGDWE
ncbi:hypothetical protein [Bacteroides sp.]|uniref:hypothetical protein n=1 Tax=Bacteroides sp. TaxID=29523 RepID=UPI003AB74EBB